MNWGSYLFYRGEGAHHVGDPSAFRGLHEPSDAAKEITAEQTEAIPPFARLTPVAQ